MVFEMCISDWSAALCPSVLGGLSAPSRASSSPASAVASHSKFLWRLQMPRVASLYLPNLATDRLRRIDRVKSCTRLDRDAVNPFSPVLPFEESGFASGWNPGARWAREEEQSP